MGKAAVPTLRMEAEKTRPQGRGPGKPPRHTRRALAATVLCYLVIVVILMTGNFLRPFEARVGEELRTDATAPFDFSVVDPVAFANLRENVQRNGRLVWIFDRHRASEARQKLNALMDLLGRSNPQSPAELNRLIEQVPSQIGIAIDPAIAGSLLPARLQSLSPPVTPEYVREQLRLIVEEVLAERHVVNNLNLFGGNLQSGRMLLRTTDNEIVEERPDPNNVLVWREGVANFLQFQALPRYFPNPGYAGLREAALAVLMQLIGGPDLSFSQHETDQFNAQRLAEIEADPPRREYHAGDVIAKAGTTLDPVQAAALDHLNQQGRALIAIKLLGLMLIIAIIFGATALYVMIFRGGFGIDASSVFLHALPVILGLAAGQALYAMWPNPSFAKFYYPAAMVALLTALSINARTGFVMSMAGSVLFGIANGLGLDFIVFALLGGFATVLASGRLRNRGDLIQVAWNVGFVNVVVVVIVALLSGSRTPNLYHVGFAFLNALLSVAGSLFLMRYFERMFGIVTDLQLLELTGLRHSLIIQLEEKAPGSYQHVLNVTKLAEAAANAIGANYLLVRAGALFHDIGKMVKPKYFSENQVTIEDKRAHSRLSPYMSVLIIKNHVKEGIELARAADLPQAVIDFIPQHHGTGLIRYFYGAALKRYEESATANPVREEDFRYPGPKPQTIEAAIVLLADSVEAIAASKFTGGQVNEDEIRRVTQMAISERFNDGQFDECDLTMRHLRDMREAFVRTLMARYHFRIAYPTLPKPPASPRAETTMTSITISGPSRTETAALN